MKSISAFLLSLLLASQSATAQAPNPLTRPTI